MKCDYLRKEGNSVIFDGEYMEIYIPKSNFDNDRSSQLTGEYLFTLGVFNFLVYREGKNAKEKAELRTLKLPFKIKIQYRTFFSTKTKLSNELDETDYMVFVLERGDLFCVNTEQAQNTNNAKDLIFLIHGGKLPNSIRYESVLDCYLGTTILNGVNLKSELVIFEFIVAELCRYKADTNLPFRKVIGADLTGNISEHDYVLINLKTLPAINSTFSALTFEDINQAIISSVKKTKNNEEENETPIEKVLKY